MRERYPAVTRHLSHAVITSVACLSPKGAMQIHDGTQMHVGHHMVREESRFGSLVDVSDILVHFVWYCLPYVSVAGVLLTSSVAS